MAGSRKTERREVKISSIEITTSCHATENCEKVLKAIKNLVPPSIRDSLRIDANNITGYYGNTIVMLSSKINNDVSVLEILRYISNKLEPIEKNILKVSFKLRYDSSRRKLVIRFSKQDLVNDKLKIMDTDDIIKLTVYFKNTRDARDVEMYLTELGILS